MALWVSNLTWQPWRRHSLCAGAPLRSLQSWVKSPASYKPDMVTHACHPSIWEGNARQHPSGRGTVLSLVGVEDSPVCLWNTLVFVTLCRWSDMAVCYLGPLWFLLW